DVLTLQVMQPDSSDAATPPNPQEGTSGLVLAPPKVRFTAQSAHEFYRRKKSTIVVRHVSGDRMVAVIEILSPGNKAAKNAFKALIDKARDLLEHKIHLLVLDLFPPTKSDPHGFHAAQWEEITGEAFLPPPGKPLTLVAYESGLTVKAYIEPVAVGDVLPDMPLYLEPNGYVLAPLEATYQAAFAAVPRRWQNVLEGAKL
ncbi:MAG TPA: DUF4058 family protein, partial [Gemmataceae bacterium]|nr:DUF4058 family protein [Gemmataceae bacterium]